MKTNERRCFKRIKQQSMIVYFLSLGVISLFLLQLTHNCQFMMKHHPFEGLNESQIPRDILSGVPPSIQERINQYYVSMISDLKAQHSQTLENALKTQMAEFLSSYQNEHLKWMNGTREEESSFAQIENQAKEYNDRLKQMEESASNHYKNVSMARIFPSSFSKVFREMKETRIRGFEYCQSLENAVFDPTVYISMFFKIQWHRCFGWEFVDG
jgi:hypothetical protein